MPLKSSSVLEFGKIKLASDSSTVWELADVLAKILERHQYPEKESAAELNELVNQAMNDAKREMESSRAAEEGRAELKKFESLKGEEEKWKFGNAI